MKISRSRLKEIIEEELWNFLSETSSSGMVAGYETPNAFAGTDKKSKKKNKEIAQQNGYIIVKKFADLTESVQGESNVRSRMHQYIHELAELYVTMKNEMVQFQRDSKGTVNEDYEQSKEALKEARSYLKRAIQSLRALEK